MKAIELAEKVLEEFQTRNVFEIAKKSRVSIVYQKWFPVTSGEFDWRTKTICVNENAGIAPEKIIAHELGHYFLKEFSPQRGKNAEFDEENFCDEFAENLLNDSNKSFTQEAQRAQR